MAAFRVGSKDRQDKRVGWGIQMRRTPGEFAHGYLTLDDDTEVLYQTSSYYAPEHGRGVRWNDPAFNISWPAEPRVIIDRDREYEDFSS